MDLYGRWTTWSDPEAGMPKEFQHGGRIVDYVANDHTTYALILVPGQKGHRLERIDIRELSITFWADEVIRMMKEKRDAEKER